jgi:hypothetical protein
MDYVINNFNEATGQISVTFGGVLTHSIDVPLDSNNLYITDEALDAYIKGFAPVDFITRKNKIAAGIANSAVLKALETEPLQTSQTEVDLQAIEDAKAAEIEKFVKAALIKNGIISV